MKLKSSLAIAFVLFLSSCGMSPNKLEVSQDGLQQVVAHSADIVIIPNIKNWQRSSIEFSSFSKKFCKSPNSVNLKQLKYNWKELSLSWNKVIMFDFGPLRDNLFTAKINFVDSMRQRGKNYSNTVRIRLNQRLKDNVKLDNQYFAGLNFNLVGIHVLEQMVFSDFTNKSTHNRSILNNYRHNPRSCELLTGMSNLNSDIASYVLDSWQKKARLQQFSYGELFKKDKLINGEKSLTKLIFSIQDYFRYIKQRKLEGWLDSHISGMAYKNMLAGLEAVEDLFTAKNSKLSLEKYLQASSNKKTADKFLKLITQAKLQATSQDRKAMKVTYSQLIKMLEQDIPKALNVDFGINFTDGD